MCLSQHTKWLSLTWERHLTRRARSRPFKMPFAYFSPFSVYLQSFHPPSLLWHRQQYWNDDDERKERLSCSYVNLKTKGANVINLNAVVVDQPWKTPTLVSAAWDAGCWTGLSQPRGQPSVKGIFNHCLSFSILNCYLYCGSIGLKS